jgi:hypothetical protein
MTIGDHAVTLSPVAGGTDDLSCLADQVTIAHGREDPSGQPEASTATIDLSLDTGDDQLPAGLEIGATLEVTTVTASTSSVRFHGRITDIVLGWEDRGEDTPDSLTCQVIAVAPLGDLGRRVVGDVPWPQELDGARVGRIMTAAGMPLDPLTSDPGTVQVLARDVDSQDALSVAQSTAESGSGLVWGTRAGEVRYADAAHRRNTITALTLDACDILVSPQWTRSTEALLNKVSLGYGVIPDGASEQPRYVAQSDPSIAAYGRYELSTETELALLADATALGQLLLTRNRDPVWIMSALPVDMKGLDDARTAVLLGFEVGSLLELTGLPVAGTAPTTAALWVEGWSETLTFGTHELTLFVSGYCRTAPPPRWDDLDPAWTWDSLPGTWDGLSCLGPLPNRGRWNDLPASLRWDQIDPAITWDTWTTLGG